MLPGLERSRLPSGACVHLGACLERPPTPGPFEGWVTMLTDPETWDPATLGRLLGRMAAQGRGSL